MSVALKRIFPLTFCGLLLEEMIFARTASQLTPLSMTVFP